MSSMNDERKGTESPTVVAQGPQNRKRTCFSWCKKFWWVLVIIVIVLVLVIVLPIIFVGVPNTIRKQINNSKLSIQGVSVLNTQSDSLQLSINSTIQSSSSHSATIDAFNISLYLEDKLPHVPFTTALMPELHVTHQAGVNLTQEVAVSDEQAFGDFTAWFLSNETFRVTVDGWTHVHVSGLPSTKVHFVKTVNLTGLNGFQGINVTQSEVSLTPDAQGDNFFGFVTIPNPSVFTVDIGNTSFSTRLNNTEIGQSYIDNLLLTPGNNNFSIRANISQLAVIGAVMSEPYCNNGSLPLTFIGENITNNGQELQYFEEGFRSNVLNLDIDVGADLKPLGLNVSCDSTLAGLAA